MSAIAESSFYTQPGVSEEAPLAEVVQLYPDNNVQIETFVCPADPDNPKRIALLGKAVLEGSSKFWPSAIRIGGSKLVVGIVRAQCEGIIDNLYDQALSAEQEHPIFFAGLKADQEDTLARQGVDFICKERAIVDYVWLMPELGKKPTWAMVHPSNKRFLVNGETRDYTFQLLSLFAPMSHIMRAGR
jgi:hypothetical protein